MSCDLLTLWYDAADEQPDTERRVLCVTQTKSGRYGFVVGYYAPDLGRWCCGMNSNVIAWMELPTPEGLMAILRG